MRRREGEGRERDMEGRRGGRGSMSSEDFSVAFGIFMAFFFFFLPCCAAPKRTFSHLHRGGSCSRLDIVMRTKWRGNDRTKDRKKHTPLPLFPGARFNGIYLGEKKTSKPKLFLKKHPREGWSCVLGNASFQA